jgi:hypothetical protein
MRACFLKPVDRMPVKVATVDGLYLVGCTAEGRSAYQDLECESALRAAELIATDFPR